MPLYTVHDYAEIGAAYEEHANKGSFGYEMVDAIRVCESCIRGIHEVRVQCKTKGFSVNTPYLLHVQYAIAHTRMSVNAIASKQPQTYSSCCDASAKNC